MHKKSLDRDHIRQIIGKYEKSLPRYTSYPTAPDWQDIDKNDQAKILSDTLTYNKDLSLYLHIPFCESRCLFCGCNTIVSNKKKLADSYLDLLIKEMKQFSNFWYDKNTTQSRVKQIHFGGGTPTFLTIPQMSRINQCIKDYFSMDAHELEYSIEIDPQPTELDQLYALREMGVNRISIGVQDFNDNILKQVNRVQSKKKIEQIFSLGRKLGFSGINMDLIYGLPGQNNINFAYTLAQTLNLQPDRIALFSYAHVPWLKPHQKSLEKYGILEGYEKFSLFLDGLEQFTTNGYQYIGLDHFAKKNDALAIAQNNKVLNRNFQGYTTHSELDLIGFGVSSISAVQTGYWQNPKDLSQYQKSFENNPLLAIRGHHNTAIDIYRKNIIREILCHSQYSNTNWQKDLAVKAKHIKEILTELEQDQLVKINDQSLQLTIYGQLFARNIASLFDIYLQQKKKSSRPQFSKSV